MKLWAIIYIQVRNTRMLNIMQIIGVIECRFEDIDKVYAEHILPYNNIDFPFRQIAWFLREPPLPWEKKETKRNV